MAFDSYTKFLSHFNGVNTSKEIQDSGATGHVVTSVASATTSTTQAKIGSSSLSLNGSTQYLTVPNHADWDVPTNWTLEGFYYLEDLPADGIRYFLYNQRQDATHYWALGILNTAGTYSLGFYFYGGADRAVTVNLSGLTADTWHHIAMTKQGNDYKFYLDAVQQGTTQTNANAPSDNTAVLDIGQANAGSFFYGYMDELRISNVVRTITVPTTAYTSDANTLLLLHMESLDVATHKSLTFVGTAQLDTAQKKFGTASLLLDGNSDYVTVPDSADWSFGTEDFTIDHWVRFASVGNCGFYSQQTDGDNRIQWYMQTGELRFCLYVGAVQKAYYQFAWVPNADQWYHLALVRSGSTIYFFIDGVSQSITETTAISTNSVPDFSGVANIGFDIGNTTYFNGYIDELRISKGIARWTSNFTPPTSEYSAITGYTQAFIL